MSKEPGFYAKNFECAENGSYYRVDKSKGGRITTVRYMLGDFLGRVADDAIPDECENVTVQCVNDPDRRFSRR